MFVWVVFYLRPSRGGAFVFLNLLHVCVKKVRNASSHPRIPSPLLFLFSPFSLFSSSLIPPLLCLFAWIETDFEALLQRGGEGNVHKEKYGGHTHSQEKEGTAEKIGDKVKHLLGMDKKA